MKRGTPDHPKTRQLAVILGLKRYEVVGILESLWHFAASYAKRGDIGRWSNDAIAAALEWSGDADALIAALVKARFVDEDEQCRLLVHDWQDHADQTVSRSEEVKKHGFAKPTPVEPSAVPLSSSGIPANASILPADASQPKPEPLPRPRPCQSRGLALAGSPHELTPAAGSALAPDVQTSSNSHGSEGKPPDRSASDSSATAPATKLPGPENFAVAIGVKLRLGDIGLTAQGKADNQTFGTLYQRHILPGHLGPPGQAVRLCYNEAMRIGDDTKRTNKAGTFLGCIKKHLETAGHEWETKGVLA
jgi:hypothetical protein